MSVVDLDRKLKLELQLCVVVLDALCDKAGLSADPPFAGNWLQGSEKITKWNKTTLRRVRKQLETAANELKAREISELAMMCHLLSVTVCAALGSGVMRDQDIMYRERFIRSQVPALAHRLRK